MSAESLRNKCKRSRTSSNDNNYSFVKNVTSRVSGLLPSTITKWFSSPSSSGTNGSVPVMADPTDSSTEDEAVDSPAIMQPPLKRMRFSTIHPTTPQTYNNHFALSDTNNMTESKIYDNDPCTSFNSIQSPPGRNTFRRETNYVSTPLRPSSETTVMEKPSEREQGYNSPSTVSQIGRSIEMKRKSLFGNDSVSAQDVSKACAKTSLHSMEDLKQPRFKPSLLGSPFYSGRTVYGGAAASYYLNKPNVKQRKVAVVNETASNNNTLSEAARRVMDLLEHYSSPIIESKRTPLNKTSDLSTNSLSTNDVANDVTSRLNKINSYKKQELHVPSVATFLKIKHRSRLMDSTAAARQIIASQSSSSDFAPYPVKTSKDTTDKEVSKHTTKIKSRLTRPKRGEVVDVETETLPPVNLPTGVLHIDKDNMPKFTFGNLPPKAPSKPTSSSSVPTKIQNILSSNIEKQHTVKTQEVTRRKSESLDNTFKFSSPLRISHDDGPCGLSDGYVFGSPERRVENNIDLKNNKTNAEIKLPVTIKEKQWKCNDCWVSNKMDVKTCVCCGGKKPSTENKEPAKCTVCKLANRQDLVDKCINCEKVQPINISSENQSSKALKSSKWKCDVCWVDNEEEAEKCVCCQGAKPKAASAVPGATVKITVAKNLFKPNTSQDTWKCDVCWINNKSNVEKCAACGESKPNSTGNTSSAIPALSTPTDSLLSDVVKKQTSKWECPSCLVRNDNDKLTCECCETAKPGTVKESEKKMFNFGVPNNSFKFGIEPKKKEAQKCNDDKEKVHSKVPSEKNNNNLSSTPSFTFGLPAKSTPSSNVEPKATFSFGVPKSTENAVPEIVTPTTSLNFKLSTPATSTETKESEQEVPKAQIQSPTAQAKPASSFAYFGTLTPISSKQELPSSGALAVSVAEKDTTVVTTTTANALPILSAETPKSTFKFASNSNTQPTPLFGKVTPSTTSSLTFTPIQTTTATSALGLFPMTNTTSPANFQSKESATSVAAPPTTSSTPLFSFGAGAPNSQSQTDAKPKFNFTFGSNKSDTPSAFKPAFGASGDNTQSSTFALPAAGATINTIPTIPVISNATPLGSATSNAALPTSNIFGGQKENMWSAPVTNAASNIFSPPSTTSASSMQKPATFTFGSSTVNPTPAFGSSQVSSPPAFGSTSTPAFGGLQPVPTASLFGSAAQPAATPAFGANPNASLPTFGSTQSSTSNVFGMSNPNVNSTPSLFSSPTTGQSSGGMFGNAATPAVFSAGVTATPAFGAPSAAGAPQFGSANPPSIPNFETPSLTPAPAPTFNFGSPQTPGVFGFGQQPQQPGVYNFGPTPGGTPAVQFNMGTFTAPAGGAAPSPTVRRLRKAIRRTTQR